MRPARTHALFTKEGLRIAGHALGTGICLVAWQVTGNADLDGLVRDHGKVHATLLYLDGIHRASSEAPARKSGDSRVDQGVDDVGRHHALSRVRKFTFEATG